jgi:hypothetical protein
MRREPVIYDQSIQRQHKNYHNQGVQVKKAREENPYLWLNNKRIDYKFWCLFHLDFYKTVVLAKEKKIIQMKYIDWDHVESMDTPDSRRVIEVVTTHEMKDIMAFQYDRNREILAQFHATFFHDVPNDTIHWMTEGVHYKVDFTSF